MNNKAIDIIFEEGEFVVFCGDAMHAGCGGGAANARFFCYADANEQYGYGKDRKEGHVITDYKLQDITTQAEEPITSLDYFL